MPFGLGGGPWWLYNRGYRGWWSSGRCFRYPWLPRWWWATGDYPSYQPTKSEELDVLKEEAKALKEELKAITGRIEQLEEKRE
jgi:hypothetical protein